MPQYMEVVGYGEDEEEEMIHGADVMGLAQTTGYDDEEVEGRYAGRRVHGRYPVIGAGAPARNSALVRVHRPDWRRTQLAPGVIAPDQGLLPLGLHGDSGTDTFTAALQTITFQGQIQKPFRAERLLVETIRTGVSAVGKLQALIFVGTDLQQLDVKPVSIEGIGATTGFGIRMTMKPAQPGVFIRLVVSIAGTPLAGADTIFADLTILGRNIH